MILLICKKSFFERITIKIPVRIHVVIKITMPLKSKNQIPKKEIEFEFSRHNLGGIAQG